MKPLRLGVIGLGVGEQHILAARARPGWELAALCDFSPEKLAEVSARHPGIPATADADSVIDDPSIDLVTIASWDNFHHAQILRALEKGKHVFVEKPLCLSREEAKDIRSALRAHPRLRLSSNLILRRSLRFMQVKALIDAGRLGDLYHLEADYNYGRLGKITEGWRAEIPFYSVIYGGGVHMVDLMMWFTGGDVTEVTAYGNRLATRGTAFRFDDCVTSILRFRNGATGKMGANFGCVYPHFHQVSVYGTKATFQNTLEGGKLVVDRAPGAPVEAVDAPYPGCQKGELLGGFMDGILAGREPEIPADAVFRTMSVCFAIEESARKGIPVTVEYV
ncbi:MAG: hypothetical protein JWP91_1956 [Fibrobacteres bacterium]|nr:hypothetical protein [Fibrobacterota bacterium]